MTDSDPDSKAAIVLIVEDEPLQRMALRDLLEEDGFQVEEAWSAGTAIGILERRTDIRLVITDIDMPGGEDGLMLAAAVRRRWPPIEILVVSAKRPPDPADLPERAEFLPKPFVSERLLARVEALFKQAQTSAREG